MFTGIVEEFGVVERLEQQGQTALLEVACEVVVGDASVGDSIAVSGCCLTVTRLTGSGFATDMMGETLERTALGGLVPGDRVNLERALPADGRLGGHLVQGHVDGVAVVREIAEHGEWTAMTFDLPGALAPFVAEKGSITVDGVSLTVTGVDERSFGVGLIPHTLAVTTLGERAVGDRVNVEVDVLARYVARLAAFGGVPEGEGR